MSTGLHVKDPLYLKDFNEIWIFLIDFKKYSNMKFHENLSDGSWVVPHRWPDTQMEKQDEANSCFLQFLERA